MKEIFELYYETCSTRLRNHLVEMNIGLARKIAHRMKNNCQLEYVELLELATLGLIKAVERYNPTHQKYFTSFALPYIRGEIQHYLRDKTSVVRITRGLYEMSSKIKKTRTTLSSQLGRTPSDTEVALYLGISKVELEEALIASKNQKYVWSLDGKLDGTDLTLGDTLVDSNSHQCSNEAILHKLESAIKCINNPAIDLIFIQGKSKQFVQKSLKLTHSQINTMLLHGMEELAKFDICNLDEAIGIAAVNDLEDFGALVGGVLPSGAMAFLHHWLSEQLVVA